MDTTTLALIELGAVFFGLGVLGRLAARIGMSPIPFYLIGGLCFGNGGFIQLGDIGAFSHIASEIGVVLLLLLLGLEYTANELISGLRRSRMAGLLDLALNAVPGAAIALILGLGPIGAFVLAGVTYISSSGIVAKVLADLGRLGNRETPVVLSILVFEDLAMAVYLPILTAILAGVSLLGGLEAVAISLGLVTVVLVLVVRYGRYVSVVLDSPDRETLLLKLLGAALLVAGIASALQVSAAVGAFLLGHRHLRFDGTQRGPGPRTAPRPVRRHLLRLLRAEHRSDGDTAGARLGDPAGRADRADEARHRMDRGGPSRYRRDGPGARRRGTHRPGRVLHRDRRAGRRLRTRRQSPRGDRFGIRDDHRRARSGGRAGRRTGDAVRIHTTPRR